MKPFETRENILSENNGSYCCCLWRGLGEGVPSHSHHYNSRPITSRCITRSTDLRVFGPTKFAVLILVVKDKSVLSLPGGEGLITHIVSSSFLHCDLHQL